MKTLMLLNVLFWNSLFCFGQEQHKIKEIEIFALPFMNEYLIPINKNEIKKMNPLYVRVVNNEEISESNINRLVTKLKINDTNQFPNDFRAVLILHYSNCKSHTYYIASGSGGIVNGNNLYKVNYSLIAAIYSFLPDKYFFDFYRKYPEIFKLPHDCIP